MSKEWEERATERDVHLVSALKRVVGVRRAYQTGADQLGSSKLRVTAALDGETRELIVDRKVDKILRGMEHGLTRELIDDGLGEIVSDIYRPYREYEGERE